MKIVMGIVVAVLLLALGVLGLQVAASERVEVVELSSQGDDGQFVTTRLWIVDLDGLAYLRAGDEGSGWYRRVSANPVVQLTRNGTAASYRATPRPNLVDRINQLMQDKYTWGDSLIGVLVGERDSAIPIELEVLDRIRD